MIAICPNPFRDTELIYTRQAVKLLEDAGFETFVCPVFADDEPEVIPADIPTRKLSEIGPECSLLVVIGGDGTILSVARTLHDAAIPLLGVNLGTKGFMAYLEPEELDYIVSAARGECKISSRMLLYVELIRDGTVIHRDQALNDVVLHGYGDVPPFCPFQRLYGCGALRVKCRHRRKAVRQQTASRHVWRSRQTPWIRSFRGFVPHGRSEQLFCLPDRRAVLY